MNEYPKRQAFKEMRAEIADAGDETNQDWRILRTGRTLALAGLEQWLTTPLPEHLRQRAQKAQQDLKENLAKYGQALPEPLQMSLLREQLLTVLDWLQQVAPQ
jgi:hypothetical protein